MPRIRTIKPQYWDDLKIAKLSRDARLIFIGMWNFADDNGAIVADATWLKSKILPYDQLPSGQFQKWINEIITAGLLVCLQHRGEEFFHVRGFTKHQVINRPNKSDVFIPKDTLESLLEATPEADVNNHGQISEGSHLEGKGKEGKGKEGEGKGKAKAFTPPTIEEVIQFFNEKGYTESLARRFFESYTIPNPAGEIWIDSHGNKVRNWKQKAIAVWMRDTDKLTTKQAKGNGTAEAIRGF